MVCGAQDPREGWWAARVSAGAGARGPRVRRLLAHLHLHLHFGLCRVDGATAALLGHGWHREWTRARALRRAWWGALSPGRGRGRVVIDEVKYADSASVLGQAPSTQHYEENDEKNDQDKAPGNPANDRNHRGRALGCVRLTIR